MDSDYDTWYKIYDYDVYMMIYDILAGGWPTPLKNDGVRQLGWWNSQQNGKLIHSCSKPPTSIGISQAIEYPIFFLRICVGISNIYKNI